MKQTIVNCFKCDKPLQAAAPDSEAFPFQPYEGVMFRSSGNYGSTVWDPQVRTWELHIIICDACLVSNKANVVSSQLARVAKYSYEHWNPAAFEDLDPPTD